jgi:hypothetical protein
MGLPLQSNGIRLRNVPPATAIVAIQAPLARVSDILLRNEHLKKTYLI